MSTEKEQSQPIVDPLFGPVHVSSSEYAAWLKEKREERAENIAVQTIIQDFEDEKRGK